MNPSFPLIIESTTLAFTLLLKELSFKFELIRFLNNVDRSKNKIMSANWGFVKLKGASTLLLSSNLHVYIQYV